MDEASPVGNTTAAFVRLMRPHQWLKNGFVLIGFTFSRQWGDAAIRGSVALVFLGFCAMASAVYVLNDLFDVESDRAHATKRLRPIASGAVSPMQAACLCTALCLGALLLAAAASSTALMLIGAYALMNVAYSLRLKHVVVVDVFVISAGFMLRLLSGTLGIGVQPSSWLLLCGLMITLFLGFAKRRAELLVVESGKGRGRKVLQLYNPRLLDMYLGITAACTVLTYALYTMSPETIALHHTDKLIYTVPFIIYGIFRYMLLIQSEGSGQDTARDLLTDRHMIVVMILWIAVTAAIIT